MATTETMSIHKALAELKLLESRIKKAIQNGNYCIAHKNSNDKISGVPINEYIKTMQSAYDKATALINRRKVLKKAVVLSNARTYVNISGVEYTVAEAIEMKNHGIEFEIMLKNTMQEQYNSAKYTSKINNEELDAKAEQYVTGLYGGRESTADQADIEKTKQSFLKMNQYGLVDPLDILDKIEVLDDKIDNFLAEVDAALSVSNSLTEITIKY